MEYFRTFFSLIWLIDTLGRRAQGVDLKYFQRKGRLVLLAPLVKAPLALYAKKVKASFLQDMEKKR